MNGRIKSVRRRRSPEMGCGDHDQMSGLRPPRGTILLMPHPPNYLDMVVVGVFALKIYNPCDMVDLSATRRRRHGGRNPLLNPLTWCQMTDNKSASSALQKELVKTYRRCNVMSEWHFDVINMRMNIHTRGEFTRVMFREEIGDFCVTETSENVQEM